MRWRQSAPRWRLPRTWGLRPPPIPGKPITVRMGDGTVDASRLRVGTRRYLRYQEKDGKQTVHDIWTRTVAFEVKDGRRQLHMTQRSEEANPAPGAALLIEQDSWFEVPTFQPTTQVRKVTKSGGQTVSGFKYTQNGVVGMKDLPGNSRSDFSLDYAERPYNFEYDMELFEALPLRRVQDFDIPFYDAGVDRQADRFIFRVVGSQKIAGWDGRPVDCWLMTGDYHSGVVKNRFWIEKRTHILIREEAPLSDGRVFIKALLPPQARDGSG